MIAHCKLAVSEGVAGRRAKSRSMTDHLASRTLVKSAPELWAECSDAASLARHLGRFGEIRITRLEPETAVAWEGEHVSGTVRLEPSGWGTRVTLTTCGSEPAVTAEIEDPPGAGARAEEEPPGEVRDDPAPPLAGEGSSADPAPPASVKPGFLMRLFGRRRRAPAPLPAPAEVRPEAEAAAADDPPVNAEPAGPGSPGEQVSSSHADDPAGASAIDPPAILASALESLGQAHHRPYSRH
jgi:hypothetical protein